MAGLGLLAAVDRQELVVRSQAEVVLLAGTPSAMVVVVVVVVQTLALLALVEVLVGVLLAVGLAVVAMPALRRPEGTAAVPGRLLRQLLAFLVIMGLGFLV